MRTWEAVHPGEVKWCGALLLSGAAQQEQPAYSCDQITPAEAAELVPCLSRDFLEQNAHQLFHFGQEGFIDPELAVTMIAKKAEARGVEFLFGVDVHGLHVTEGGVVGGVLGSRGQGEEMTVLGDIVVLANGTGVEELARSAGICKLHAVVFERVLRAACCCV
jgi:glycine/D-amino acid oxidase-like deaminating enzyme